MGKELTQLQYVSCPDCYTLFKPRNIPRTPADSITCICCKQIFTLAQSYIYRRSKTTATKPLRAKSKRQLTIRTKAVSGTEAYLKKYRLKSRLLFLTFISIPFVMVSILTGSVLHYKNELAQNLQLRPYVEQFCNILNCKLNEFSDFNYVLVEDNAMVSVPGKENMIQLFAMLKNIGTFDQKYPNLQIKFTDINGKLIQQKTIEPRNYLNNGFKNSHVSQSNLLAKNSQHYISLLVPDPGPKAINYEITLK